MTMKRWIISGVLVLALSGCGDDQSKDAKPDGPPSSSPSPTPSKDLQGMKDICPRVEFALPSDLDTGDPEALAAFREDLVQISLDADLEADNALQHLIDRIINAQIALADPDPDYVPALVSSQAVLAGLDDFAGRCETAGSSALQ